jgi:hypothetical protein
MPYPPNVGTGIVKGQFLRVPGGDPYTPTIKFTPSVSRLLDASSVPPVTIMLTPQSVTADADGSFDLELIANDDTDLNPVGWTYRVDVSASAGYKAYTIAGINVPQGVETDLTLATPVGSSNGVLITKGDKGDPGVANVVVVSAPPDPEDTVPGVWYLVAP